VLIDPFGRAIDYVRLSVTDRCDLRCNYCLPKGFKGFEEPAHWLSFDEIVRLMSAFVLQGVSHIRLTGGEPLLRRDLPALAARLSALPGLADLSLSTNATQLARHARALKSAGVTRLNVSLDTLDPAQVRKITGRDVLAKVLEGLDAAHKAGFRGIKLNCVIMPGVNDDTASIDALVDFARVGQHVLRFIETMPMGDAARTSGFVSLQPIRRRLQERHGLYEASVPGAGPARYLSNADGSVRVGFITPLSQHFCESCNRVRISVDGHFYPCLGQEAASAFAPLLRAGADAASLQHAVRAAIARKPERHEFREAPEKVLRFMSMTGG
jgi:cyclic pyranopterin phosphate synthase